MNPAEALDAVRQADAALGADDAAPFPYPLPVGELAPLVAGVTSALERSDWWLPSLRERVGAAVRGVPVDRLADARTGARPYRVVPPGSAPALRALLAVGIAHAERAHDDRCVVVHLGVGSAADGALHEALNLAALLQPRVVFVVSVHPLDGDAPLGRQLAASPRALAEAFGIPAAQVDGSDAEAVAAAVRAVRDQAGPHLIEARLGGSGT
ncbi:MAG: thiamine pyrophosphate-dependent enzyme [Myxococcota bacterium]